MINHFNFGPFLIAAYSGYGKPKSVEDFMQDFVSEMISIQTQGFEYEGGNIA
jgi:hypothetical protein